MNPVIERLNNTLFTEHPLGIDAADPVEWAFAKRIKELKPDFYRKIIPSHLILNMEYSFLGQQIRLNLSGKQLVQEKQIVEQLAAAIVLAELLEHVYQHYLLVPREVERLRAQQQLYRALFMEIKKAEPASVDKPDLEQAGWSFSQEVRQGTININLYRLLLVRSKRVLDLIAALEGGASWYRQFIGNLDRCTDPWLPHLAFFFYVPRLVVNLGLLIKHTVPGFWMAQNVKDLGWSVRLQGQLLRRWFELANDIPWVAIGFVNGYLLTGAWGPIGIYLSIAFFGYDAVVSATRAYLERGRLYELRKQYEEMLSRAVDKSAIEQHLQTLEQQITFETLRLWSHVATTTGIFLAMACGAPFFAATPAVALVGAIALVVICFINFALVALINQKRPQDMVEMPSGGLTKLGFFAKRNETPSFPSSPEHAGQLDEHHGEDDTPVLN